MSRCPCQLCKMILTWLWQEWYLSSLLMPGWRWSTNCPWLTHKGKKWSNHVWTDLQQLPDTTLCERNALVCECQKPKLGGYCRPTLEISLNFSPASFAFSCRYQKSGGAQRPGKERCTLVLKKDVSWLGVAEECWAFMTSPLPLTWSTMLGGSPHLVKAIKLVNVIKCLISCDDSKLCEWDYLHETRASYIARVDTSSGEFYGFQFSGFFSETSAGPLPGVSRKTSKKSSAKIWCLVSQVRPRQCRIAPGFCQGATSRQGGGTWATVALWRSRLW